MQKRILIVDDDQSILDAISLLLEAEGYSVSTIFKGDEVYNKVLVFKPNIILLDVLMSGKDGRHICKNLKKETSTKNIPIIMISAHPSGKKGAVESGANDFLPKPFEADDLLLTIKKYL